MTLSSKYWESQETEVHSFCCRYVLLSKTSSSNWEGGLGVLCAYCCTPVYAWSAGHFPVLCKICSVTVVTHSLSLAVPAGMTSFQAIQLLEGFVVFIQLLWETSPLLFRPFSAFRGGGCCYSVLCLHYVVYLEMLWQKFRSDLFVFFFKKAQQQQKKNKTRGQDQTL